MTRRRGEHKSIHGSLDALGFFFFQPRDRFGGAIELVFQVSDGCLHHIQESG